MLPKEVTTVQPRGLGRSKKGVAPRFDWQALHTQFIIWGIEGRLPERDDIDATSKCVDLAEAYFLHWLKATPNRTAIWMRLKPFFDAHYRGVEGILERHERLKALLVGEGEDEGEGEGESGKEEGDEYINF